MDDNNQIKENKTRKARCRQGRPTLDINYQQLLQTTNAMRSGHNRKVQEIVNVPDDDNYVDFEAVGICGVW